MFGERATLTTLRHMNAQTVLEVIESRYPVTRAEVARVLGMAKPTAANAFDLLLEAGLVRQSAEPPAGAHYAAVYFEPAPDIAYVVGIDAGTRYVRGSVADLHGAVLARHDVPLREGEGFAERFGELRRRLAGEPSWSRVVAAVVGVPGLVDLAGGRVWETSVGEWEDFPIAMLTDTLGVPAELENDVNLAALGEQWRGAGRDVRDFAYLSVGTGVGAGLILSGALHRGFHGAAGEVDYPAGRADDRSGTPSAAGLIGAASRRLARWTGATVLAEPLTPEAVFAALAAGDELADHIVSELARRIARTIAPIAQVVDVELVVLGGGIGGNHEVLAERVRPLLTRVAPRPPRVVRSQLGDAAVLLGAVSVATRRGRERVIAERLAAAKA